MGIRSYLDLVRSGFNYSIGALCIAAALSCGGEARIPENRLPVPSVTETKTECNIERGYNLNKIGSIEVKTQNGINMDFRDFLNKSVDDVVTRTHVVNKVFMPSLLRNKNQQNLGEITFLETWDYFQRNFSTRYTLDLEHGRDLIKQEGGQSVQSLQEFLDNGFRGDCDDISFALFSAYHIIRTEAENNLKTSTFPNNTTRKEWMEIRSYFTNNDLYLAYLTNVIDDPKDPAKGAHLIVLTHDTNTGKVRAIEPQLIRSFPSIIIKNNTVKIKTLTETYNLLGLYSSKNFFGVDGI